MAQSSNEAGSRLNLRIKFRSENLESFVERYGSDVSPGGIFIRSKTPLEIGTKVSFTLSLINGVPVLLGEGTVVWARKPESESPGGNPGMGIRFDQLTDESRMKLNRVLEAKAAHDKAGKPSVRGPTPIPDPPGGFGTSEATAKMRLTDDGRIVRDMPAAPPVQPAGPAPSQPYAASFSQPQGTGAQETDATQVSAPPTERVRRSTPALGMDGPQPFAPSKTLGSGAAPLASGGGAVVRAPKPATTLPLRSPTPPFGTQPTGAPGPSRSPAPGFTQPPTTRAAGGSAFSSTAAFGAEPTRMQGLASGGAPTRAGATPGPDLLRRATPPPVPVPRPSSIFSKPTPTPIAPSSEYRSGPRSGPVVSRPSAQRPAVVDAPKPQAGGWGDDKTEIVEDLPPFDEIEEKTTTVRGQVLAEAEGFGRMPPTRPDIPKHLTPRPPQANQAHVDELNQFPVTPAPVTMPALDNLFDGEALPTAGESSSLLSSIEAEQEFARNESTARGRGLAPAGPSTGTSMVAHRVDYVDEERRRGRPALWILLGVVLVGAGVFAFVEYTDSQQRGAAVAPVVPVAVPEEAPAPPQDPSPVEAPEPQPTAEAEPAKEPAKPVAVEPEKPAPSPKPTVAEKPAPRPAPTPRPAPAPRPRAPVAAAPTPAPEDEVDDANAIYWLRVRSVPAGAEVFIDGEPEGVTPFQRRIFDSTRPYALSVRKEGFESHERMLSSSDPWVKAKGEYLLTVTVKLRKAPGAAPAAEPENENASENGAVILDP